MREVAVDPGAARNVKELKGREGDRLRVEDWRVIYQLEDGAMILIVIRVAPRDGAYD